MKKLISVLLASVFISFSGLVAADNNAYALGSSTNDLLLVDNDFSSSDLSAYKLKGNWTVKNGALYSGSGSGSAYLVYDIPEQYKGMSYQVDVDFLGHTTTGGILIGAEGKDLSPNPTAYLGFDAFLGPDGTQAALGCYSSKGGWGGNVVVSDYSAVPRGDVHLRVRVVGDNLTYTVTSLDGKTKYFGVSYDLGTDNSTAVDDIYTAFGKSIGLRKFYNDKGCFDNFRFTVFVDDVLPEMTESISLGGVDFESHSLRLAGQTVSGSGAMLTKDKLDADINVSVLLKPCGVSKLLFGMKDENNGYSFEIDKNEKTVSLYQITDGKYLWLGSKNVPVGDGAYLTTVSVNKKTATVTFDAFSQGKDAFCSFGLKLADYRAGKLGIWLEGGEISSFSVTESTSEIGGKYTNPVNTGADPALIYHEGTYYLYHNTNYESDAGKNDIFRVYTSPNLVDWTPRNIVFTHKSSYTNQANGYMSPIPFYYEGVFYLFFSGHTATGEAYIFYAVSDSPYGPFEYKDGEKPLHRVKEIYGLPFLDDDGKLYMIYNRFGNGNHVYIEQIKLDDGVFSTVPGTLKKLISPITEYENDGYGFISEGGSIYKHNGYYYLVWSAGHYKGHYGLAYATSKNIYGPYTRYEYNEVLTHNSAVDGVGYGVFASSPDGRELYMLYHSHNKVGQVAPRRTCVDKVSFVSNPDGGPDVLTINGPSTTAQPLPSNIYRYDVDRDGKIRIADALLIIAHQRSDAEYCGAYDVDASGTVGRTDVGEVLARALVCPSVSFSK